MYSIILTDKPGAPENPHVKSWTEDSITLGWEEPRDDGGCEVTGYVVEYRETGKKSWQSGGTTEEHHKVVTGLSKSQSYSLQVAAENEVGRGPFVELAKPATPKSQFGKRCDLQRISTLHHKCIDIKC